MTFDYNKIATREIVLFGEARICQDISDFFKELNIVGTVISEDLNVECLFAERRAIALIVLCSFVTEQIERQLCDRGLKYGVDCIRVIDLIKVIDEVETYACAVNYNNRKIIVFGTGYNCGQMLLRNPHLKIDYFVDNNEAKHGDIFHNAFVYSVDALRSEKQGEFVVIVSVNDNDFAVRMQLEMLGFVLGEDFYYFDLAFSERSCDIEKSFVYELAKHHYGNDKLCPVSVVGTGNASLHMLNMERLPIDIDYFYSNSVKATFQGFEVRGLAEIYDCKRTIIITDDIPLEQMWISDAPCFPYKSTDKYSYAEMLLLTIIDDHYYDINCDYTSRGMLITEHGEFAPCSLMCKAYFGNLYHNNIKHLMRSIGARIAWLSVIKGNYSFCFNICNFIRQEMTEGKTRKRRQEMPLYCERINISYDASCNLACPSCRDRFITKPIDDSVSWLHKEVLRVLPDLTRVLDSYGEMFMSSYMDEIYFIRGLATDELYMLSNGIAFNENNFEKIRRHYKKVYSGFSIDAATKETYERMRKGNFETLKKRMAYAGRLRANNEISHLTIIFVIQKENYREMKKFVEWGFAINADKVYFKVLTNRVGWTAEDFIKNDVYNVDCPEHDKFMKLTQDPIFYDERVHLPSVHSALSDETYYLC